jgi:hypothetical protein
MLASAAINAANAVSSAPAKDESQLEFFFGAMALIAVVTMLIWLYLRSRQPGATVSLPVEPPEGKDSGSADERK